MPSIKFENKKIGTYLVDVTQRHYTLPGNNNLTISFEMVDFICSEYGVSSGLQKTKLERAIKLIKYGNGRLDLRDKLLIASNGLKVDHIVFKDGSAKSGYTVEERNDNGCLYHVLVKRGEKDFLLSRKRIAFLK